MKMLLFFALLIGFIAGWLYFFKPFEVSMQKVAQAQVRFRDFLFRSYTPKGVELYMQGEEGVKKKDGLYVKNVYIEREEESIKAKEAQYDEFLLQLEGNVFYKAKKFRFFTQRVNYFIESKIVQVPSPFRLEAEGLNVEGSKLLYNINFARIIAYNIKAKIKSER